MLEIVILVAVFIASLMVGAFFFGGLLWTVQHGLTAKNPAIFFLGSWLIRVAVVVSSFYLLSAGRWERLLLCTIGFLIARVLVVRLTAKREVSNAS